MNRPTATEIQAFLEGNAVRYASNASTGQHMWGIRGFHGAYITYPQDRALALAELCLLTGQPLTDVFSIEMQLGMARRIADLEARFPQYGCAPATEVPR